MQYRPFCRNHVGIRPHVLYIALKPLKSMAHLREVIYQLNEYYRVIHGVDMDMIRYHKYLNQHYEKVI